MPFKIVQTRENGTNYLEIVPSGWEKNGTVWFPNTHLRTHQRNEKLKPNSKEFYSMTCVLKREGIPTFKEANSMISLMQDQSDTDGTDIDTSNTSKVLMLKGSKTMDKVATIPSLAAHRPNCTTTNATENSITSNDFSYDPTVSNFNCCVFVFCLNSKQNADLLNSFLDPVRGGYSRNCSATAAGG